MSGRSCRRRAARSGGCGHGVLGALAGRHDHVVGGLALRHRHVAVERGRELVGIITGDRLGLAAPGRGGGVPDPDDLGVLGEVGAGGVKALEHVVGDRRQVPVLCEQRGDAQRIGHERRRRDPRLPGAGVHQRHGGRAAGVAGGGEQRADHAGGVGDRVAAADADGVARGRGRESELGRRLVVVGAGAQLRRRAVPVPEVAARERERGEDEQGEDAVHGGSGYGSGPAACAAHPRQGRTTVCVGKVPIG